MSADEVYANELSSFFDGFQFKKTARVLIPETRVLVASDAHLPYTDPALLERLLSDIMLYDIQCVVWAGDFNDMHHFSHYGVTDHNIDYQEVKKLKRRIIERTASILTPRNGYQVFSMGNHDYRWIKKMDDYENLDGLFRSLGVGSLIDNGDIVISENPVVEAVEDGPRNPTWVIVHPAQFKAPFKTPCEMALMEQKHVMSAHAHHFGMTTDASGKYWAVESGGLFDASKFTYVNQNPSTMRRMVSGYWILIDDNAPLGICGNRMGRKVAC